MTRQNKTVRRLYRETSRRPLNLKSIFLDRVENAIFLWPIQNLVALTYYDEICHGNTQFTWLCACGMCFITWYHALSEADWLEKNPGSHTHPWGTPHGRRQTRRQRRMFAFVSATRRGQKGCWFSRCRCSFCYRVAKASRTRAAAQTTLQSGGSKRVKNERRIGRILLLANRTWECLCFCLIVLYYLNEWKEILNK